MIIAVDGPAASGKGTIAAALAAHYELPHLDTGLLYRAVGMAVDDGADEPGPDLEARAVRAARALDPATMDRESLVSARAGVMASRIAIFPEVRRALFDYQRAFALRPGGAVLDGRDTGTNICPEADVKIFVVADEAARVARRAGQLEGKGLSGDRAALAAEIAERDARDRNAAHGGFRRAEDAYLLDTTGLDIESAIRAAVEIVDKAMARKAGRPA